MKKIITSGLKISVISKDNEEYISLTDMAKFKNNEATGIVIVNWLSTKYTIQFMGAWEKVNNPNFNVMEFNNIRNEAGSNGYILSSSIKENLIPKQVSKNKENIIYASEADVLNVALFGKTAKDWKTDNPKLEGNIRDYCDVTQLVVLANLEGINAELIRQKLTQQDRLIRLNQIAIFQIKALVNNSSLKKLA